MSTFLQSPWLKDLGWVLVHSLWQGATLWALLALVFAVGRHHLSAAAKHRLAWLTLTALALVPVITMIWMQVGKPEKPQPAQHVYASIAPAASKSPAPPPPAASPEKSDVTVVPLSTAPPTRPTDAFVVAEASKTSWVAQLPIWFATAWLAGLTLLTIRLLFGWRWIAGLKHTGTDPEPAWLAQFVEWANRAGLRHVRVLVCPALGVPLVVGWLRPVICFPASLLSRLSLAEVESLMLHELAHLKRRDPLLQFWVTVVETLLFHNPAAHALASTVRQTGELACDDLVLQWKGDGKTYARALAAAEEWRGAQFALAATGMGSLKHRIQRILGLGEHGRLTSLPERFGITSVAGIALYFVVCGLAVPRIARALTPEERITVINQEREALKITEDNAAPQEIKATGTVRTADGSKPKEDIGLTAWSKGYTSFYSGNRVGQQETVRGKGSRMHVGSWTPGYAPAITQATFDGPDKNHGAFELVIERGFPAVLKLVDKDGQPIPDAELSCTVYLAPECDFYRQGPLRTDAAGTCIPGNTLEGLSFRFDIRAYGYQWNRFQDVRFEKDKPVTLTLVKSTPIVGTVADARTQQPIAGVNVLCEMRRRDNGAFNHGYGYGIMPRMNAEPSDAQGKLALNICHPNDTYDLLLEAPGYGRKFVQMGGESGVFKFELEPELVFSGTIEDPEKKVMRKDSNIYLRLDQDFGPSGGAVDLPLSVKADASNTASFEFRQLSPGKLKLRVYEKEWETDFTSSMKDLRFRIEDGTLKCLSIPEKATPSAEATREVELVFTTPKGSPPFNGEVPLVIKNSTVTSHKVTDGICRVRAPLNTQLNIYSGGITGYRFDRKWEKIEAGDGPLHIDIPMEPAGAISGDIRMYPGFQVGRSDPYLILLKYEDRAGEWQTVHNDSGQLLKVLDHGSRFFISPVSLNARYRILIRHDTSITATPEFVVDEATPLMRKDISFPDGDTLRGTVLQPDGTPMEGGNIYLIYKEPAHRITSSNLPIKSDGTFELPHMNFDVDGLYYLSVPATRGIAPLIARLNGPASPLRLQRESANAVEGVVVGLDGAPLQGVKLHFAPVEVPTQTSFVDIADSLAADSPTDAEGKFRVSTLPAGKFRVFFGWEYIWATGDQHSMDDPAHMVEAPMPAGKAYKFVLKKR
ncbi:beta-lactamase regulating signal transducer with metallopeptidase domain [Roseimicrobium gellanilyticum]|uniref:Beta-lactamase regulating signal transducer with metallopeptidase domain n=1 Tax=Roseimicrobium gellanilyticum TaxID=748857 RepID=A0A366HEQ7_9BACT|nr:M56 family metallopeptidase [Roseimicrobium gellanilyticum]RBP40409.1 beta-lactamase regulating signal transducer with metallopeptidase domain [Roseimicrobium gellanilyticum]